MKAVRSVTLYIGALPRPPLIAYAKVRVGGIRYAAAPWTKAADFEIQRRARAPASLPAYIQTTRTVNLNSLAIS